jgi:hypothetical protein
MNDARRKEIQRALTRAFGCRCCARGGGAATLAVARLGRVGDDQNRPDLGETICTSPMSVAICKFSSSGGQPATHW